MPNWRKPSGKKTWPLSRTGAPQFEGWTAVRRSGPSGIALVVLGLAWWKIATSDGTTERDECQATIEDFSWVMSQLLKVDAPPSSSMDGLPQDTTASTGSSRDGDGSCNSTHAPATSFNLSTAEASASTGTRGRKRAAGADDEQAGGTRGRKKGRR